MPANRPLQNDNPMKKEETKNVPPGTVFVTVVTEEKRRYEEQKIRK